jgi:multiple sugar transport system substrate-binding protein
MALNDLIASDGYDTSVFFPESLVAASHEGSLYSLPWICHPGRVGCYYNKNLFADNNLEEPPEDGDWNFEDLLDLAQALTQDTDGDGQVDQFGMQIGLDPWSLLVWVRGSGGELYEEGGNTSTLDSEESLSAIQFIYDLLHTHNVAPTPEQVTSGMFVSGRIGMVQSGYWGQSMKGRIGDRFEMGGAPMPKGPAGVMGSMYEFDPACIYSGTEHPDETFLWAKWLANQETGIRIAEVGSVPGSRPDVWENERLTKFPIHNVFTQIMYNVMPFRGPGNFRGLEMRDAYNNGMDPIWLGNGEPAEVVPQVTAKLQEILDKPAA